MSTSVELQGSPAVWKPPLTKPLDEAVWQAWVAKGRARDRRGSTSRVNAVQWVSIAALLVAAGLWSHLATYDVVVRFIVAAGAIVVMLNLVQARRYTFAAVFGALALLYTPVVSVFSFSGDWQRAVVVASAAPFAATLAWRRLMDGTTASRSVLGLLLSFGLMPAPASAADLSKYRSFELGTDLPTIAKQVGSSPSQAKVIHRRPALIQDLAWRPQALGPSSRTESAQEVIFSFYDGSLFRITTIYDRYETEGLTADDFIAAISATYGTSERPTAPANAVQGTYGEQDEVVARWQDSQYCYDLIRSAYSPSFRLVGVLKGLQAPVQAAITEAMRLDDQEAPQREAARTASEAEAAGAKLEKARLVNKLKFRP
jgi:hypothetical protein